MKTILNKIASALIIMLAGAAFLGVIGFGIWWEVSLWNECRATNSFFYCVRTLSH